MLLPSDFSDEAGILVPNASRLLDLWDREEYQYKKCMGCLKKSPRTPDKLLCDDCLEEVKIIAERFLGDRARTTHQAAEAGPGQAVASDL